MIKEQMSKASCFDTHSSLLLQLLLSQGGWGPAPRIAGNSRNILSLPLPAAVCSIT